MKTGNYSYKNLRRNSGLNGGFNHRRNLKLNNGVTLLEVLLYIGIFTILCISIIFLYVSILSSAHSIKINIERAEVAFFIYEIARYKMDTESTHIDISSDLLKVEDFSRVLKHYPNLRMSEISTEYMYDNDADFTDVTVPHKIKIMYKLIFHGVNTISEKTFLHTFYINLL